MSDYRNLSREELDTLRLADLDDSPHVVYCDSFLGYDGAEMQIVFRDPQDGRLWMTVDGIPFYHEDWTYTNELDEHTDFVRCESREVVSIEWVPIKTTPAAYTV